MDDKELADAVVALGVGSQKNLDGTFFVPPSSDTPIHYKYFVRDWRVAGALMEKLVADGRYVDIYNCKKHYGKDSLPRAITEACVAALTATITRK